MSGKVTPMTLPGSKKDLGTFKVKNYNMFNEKDSAEYAELRTKANDRSSGVQIDHIREFTRKIVETSGEGENRYTTQTEDLYIMVQWWEKPVTLGKVTLVGDEPTGADFSQEHPVQREG